jgi:RNA polymerase sigma-70 factor (ECF subfamily)
MALRVASALLGRPGDAEDVFQEAARAVFERAETGGVRFDGEAHARNYLFRTLRNLCADRRGDPARRHVPAEDELLPPAGPAPHDDLLEVEERLAQARRLKAVRAALAGLSRDERRALRLRFHERLTYRAMAERTGVPLSTLQARVEAALEKTRRILGNGPCKE